MTKQKKWIAQSQSTSAEIVFIQHAEAPLEAGDYTVSVTQSIKNLNPTNDDNKIDDSFAISKSFAVQGERFQLKPNDVSSVFPPENNRGEFFNTLPHIVFNKRTLPWIRELGNQTSVQTTPPANIPSWIAVLLFDASDPAPKIQQGTLQDLLTPPSGTFFPTFKLEYGEAATDACLYIDVPTALFSEIVPNISDLGWLAHVRSSVANSKDESFSRSHLSSLGIDDPAATDYSIVIGNRLPLAGSQSQVFVVSLENMAPYLPDENGTASSQIPSGTNFMRLAVLKNWSFSSVQEKETFSGYLLALNDNQNPSVPTSLQLPQNFSVSTDAEKAVSNALYMGYVAMNHSTRKNDQLVSWYRGPLLPYGVETSRITVPLACSDAAAFFNPDTGMFDVSYAMAWQLGQLMGLRSRQFANDLFNWKRNNSVQTINQVEQSILQEDLVPQT